GSGFAPTQHYGYGAAPGYGVAPEPAASTSPAVPATERSGSPVLAVAGLLSMGVAVWAIVGAPVLTTAIMLAAGLVVAVLVGLVMVARRCPGFTCFGAPAAQQPGSAAAGSTAAGGAATRQRSSRRGATSQSTYAITRHLRDPMGESQSHR